MYKPKIRLVKVKDFHYNFKETKTEYITKTFQVTFKNET